MFDLSQLIDADVRWKKAGYQSAKQSSWFLSIFAILWLLGYFWLLSSGRGGLQVGVIVLLLESVTLLLIFYTLTVKPLYLPGADFLKIDPTGVQIKYRDELIEGWEWSDLLLEFEVVDLRNSSLWQSRGMDLILTSRAHHGTLIFKHRRSLLTPQAAEALSVAAAEHGFREQTTTASVFFYGPNVVIRSYHRTRSG
jgi:hypothetical protein